MTHKRQTEWQTQREDLLIAIDQLEQITEVMGEVLHRVKKQVSLLEVDASHHSEENKKIVPPKKQKNRHNTKAKKLDLVH